MLNISPKRINNNIETERYTALLFPVNVFTRPSFVRIIAVLFIIGLALLFAPWTQNIQSEGRITALRPDQRPQTIQNTIPGKIEHWYVREGQLVDVGDTILYLSEIKPEYIDPQLINRVKDQVEAKAGAIDAYEDKLKALDRQIHYLNSLQRLTISQVDNKVKQARLKMSTDSAAVVAAEIDLKTQEQRLERQEELYKKGLVSLTELESRRLKYQSAKANLVKLENQYGLAVNEYINQVIEQDQIVSQYAEKISEVESKRSTAGTELYSGLADMAKMKNQLANYQLRSKMYYVVSPIRGYISQALQVGIGENIKENTPLTTIIPEHWDKAVEMFVEPIDLPLVHTGNEVNFLFDGWPAVVFSGWPNMSYGTFSGQVVAVDYNIGKNGKYRILVAESDNQPWPEALKVGTGAHGIVLLNNVPVWYELWRQLNGFPPDYYTVDVKESNEKS